ncbi:MAG: hypothetical protein H0T56_09665 [Pseudaminobacter sp.]|nr:hypothetical protein [Pseudaminobacter sp.]
MNNRISTLLAAAALLSFSGAAHADEAEFLQSLEGAWAGDGSVKVRTDSKPVKVKCKFASDTTATSLALDGNCTGMLVFSRAVTADLKANGSNYSGSYTGAGTGAAGLTGSRSGNAINLAIRWNKDVNGDREAVMTVKKSGDNGMVLTTTDVDPKTGKSVITSQINLRRS